MRLRKNANLQKKNASVGDITASATNSAGIYSLAGGIAIGGNTAVGASFAWNQLGLNTHANIIDSVINANDLTLQSLNTSSILTVALGGAGGETAVGGTIAVVISESTTKAGIYDSEIKLSGDFLVDATSRAGLGAKAYYAAIRGELADDDNEYLNDGGFDTGAVQASNNAAESKKN